MPGKDLKVLEINTETTWRGGERQTLRQIQGFLSASINIEALCRSNSPLVQKLTPLDIILHEVKGIFGALSFLIKHGKSYDILHCQTARAQSFAVLTKPFHKCPIVYTRRVDFKPESIFARYKYSKTDKIIAISEAIREVLRDFDVEDVEVIPSIAQSQELNRKRIEEFSDQYELTGRKVIGTIAALVPHKDPLTMVNAIEALSKLRGDFIFLHFGAGPLLKEIESSITQKGLDDYYKTMGYYDNVEDFFQIFDCFVMSSQEEGLGSSVLDAFLYKVPVVSTDAGGLKELVTDHGVVCPVKDYSCLAESIDKILNEQGSDQELVDKAYDDAIRDYSSEFLSIQYIDIFNSLLKISPRQE
ncbi:MAG: glycosyltransferase [Candidatus Electryonea clarkiae]|nr:glycosyltransferase [Candidatus Electryonea clarkiae]MDP8288592.1 glycosyltransferase [Candidatus Electryonea clarkiae]